MAENCITEYGRETSAIDKSYIESGLLETESGRLFVLENKRKRIEFLESLTKRMEELLEN